MKNYTVDFITEYKDIGRVREFLAEEMGLALIFVDDEDAAGKVGLIHPEEDGFSLMYTGPEPINLAKALAKAFQVAFTTEVFNQSGFQRQMVTPSGALFWVGHDDDYEPIFSNLTPVEDENPLLG